MLFEPGHLTLPSFKAMVSTLSSANFHILSRQSCTIRSRGRIPLISNRNNFFETQIRVILNKFYFLAKIYCLLIDFIDYLFGGETVVITAEKL